MRSLILLTILLGLTTILRGQMIDSIKVEQTGDFIKIGYQIPDSRPGQIFRIRVLCSINGGLNTEIKSVSGDTGDNVQGGKEEYFVVWDVLKDVEELNSAEFIVRAELVKDADSPIASRIKNEITEKWSKKWIYFGPAIELPAPKPGFMVGVMGSFGAAFIVNYGGYAVKEEVPVLVGTTVDLNDFLDNEKVIPTTYLLTKRIVNYNSLQMHLMGGFQRTRLIFMDSNALDGPYRNQKVYGPAVGLTTSYNHFAFTLVASHCDPGQVEKEGDLQAISYTTFFSACLGLRF